MSIKNIVTSQVPNITEYDAGSNITGVGVANMFLYNQILSADRIRQNYYALKGRFGV